MLQIVRSRTETKSGIGRPLFRALFHPQPALCLLLLTTSGITLAQAPNVLTWRYDSTYQGQNTQETILTPNNVNPNTFGKLFTHSVDGQVYAQPLYVGGLTLGNGTTHNVIFIADEHNSVYAFDADSNGGTNSAPLWQASMISTTHGAAAGATTVPTADVQSGAGDIHPEIGISGTPVIDLNSKTIFLVAKSKESGTYVQRLHALNLLNGNEQPGSPIVIHAAVPGSGNASSGGTLNFSQLWQNNRSALGLFNGNIYIGFGSHGDDGPWHGWVLVYNQSTLTQTAAFCASPNGNGNGVWMAGAGFPIDTVSANGRAFLATGNGDYTAYPPLTSNVDYGDSVLRFDLSNGGFTPTSAFTPFNQSSLNGADLDQGSGGVLLLPDQAGPYPHLLIQVGKEGRILVLNRDNLNGYAPGGNSNPNAVQDITGALKSDQGLWSTPAYWNGNVYMWAENDALKSFSLANGVLTTRAVAQSSATSGFPGASAVVSSNGTQNGIVWALVSDLYSSNGSSILYAFNATNVAAELYASNQNSTRDDAGPALKFTVPVVTNGKVYVGAGYQVDVYGLLSAEQQAPAPMITPAGGAYSAAQQITLSDTIAASIYYSIDGSTPTASSTLYTGPFTLSTAATVQAIASAGGYLQSAVSSATYSFSTQTAAPQFSPAAGSYTTPQSVTLSDTVSGTQIYYTTDGTVPTTSSPRYTAPIAVNSSTVVHAMAVAPGLTASNPVTAAYVIQAAGAVINFGNGFASVAGMTLNGSAINNDDTRLQLTTGQTYQAGSAFYNTPVNIQSFTTDFAFQLSNAQADGFTFTIQNVGPTALGQYGGSLGYGPNQGGAGGIAKSVALKFDFFNNSGEGTNSTGIYSNGALPTVPAVDMTSSGVLLSSGDSMGAHITYDGANLVLTVTDNVVNKVFTQTFPINIPATIGSNTGYLGFTGGTGGLTAGEKILSWTFASSNAAATQTPSFAPAGGVYSVPQSATLSDGTAGAVIYYTLDGSAPSTSSAVYSSPISLSTGTVTIHAIAQAPGFSVSSVASTTFTIQSSQVTAEPVFAPVPGTYPTAQSVSLSSATTGSTIYYTVDGSAPSHSSTLYTAPIMVNGVSLTIRAFASASGYQDSPIVVGAYQIQSQAGGGAPVSDDFTAATLNPAVWQVVAPAGGGAAVSNGELVITVPAGSNHDAFVPGLDAVQVVQPIANGNFDVAVKIDSRLATPALYSGMGLMVEGDARDYIRFEIGQLGTTTSLNVDTIVAGVQTAQLTLSPFSSYTVPTYLRLQRVGTTFTAYWSADGVTWSQAVVFTDNIVVTGLAPYAGNYDGTPAQATAVTASFDWFHNLATSGPAAAATPTFTPASGTSFTSTVTVSIADTTPGATIYYTTDGTAPTTGSPVYGSAFPISVSTTVNAIAVAAGYTPSAQASASYTYLPPVPPPVTPPPVSGSPVSDEFTAVTLNSALWQVVAPAGGSAAVSNGELVITVPAGSNHDAFVPALDAVQVVQPIANGNFDVAVKIDSRLATPALYSGMGLMVEGDARDYIRFEIGQLGTTTSLNVDTIVAGVQTAQLTLSPFSSYTVPTYLRLQRVGTTFTAYWSADGVTWNQAAVFTDSIVVTGLAPYAGNYDGTPAQATAVTASFDWFHNLGASGPAAAATPTFTPANGTSFSSTVTVSIADTTPGATIYYTTDGTAPTTGSSVYASALSISASTTVNAIAVATGFTQSAQASASYAYLPPVSGSPISDEFTAATLNPALWQVVAPAGGSAAVSNGELVITVPAGSNHDAFVPALDAVQVVQPIGNGNFDVALKIDSRLATPALYSGMGLMVEGDARNYIRFEIGKLGTTTSLNVDTIVAGAQTAQLTISPFSSYAVPTYLRLQRVGTTFTAYWSTDGVTWNQAAVFTDSIVVTGLAPYAGNYDGTPAQATAVTASFDWFHNRATDGP